MGCLRTGITLAVITTLLPGILSAQKAPALINASLVQPEKPFVYIGMENVIMLRGEVPGKYIRMERSAGPLQVKAGTSLRTTLFYKEGGFDTIRVYSDDKLVLQKVYEIKKPGPLAATLPNVKDSLLTTAELLKAGKLTLSMPGTFYRPKGKVLSYMVTVYSPAGKVTAKYKNEGDAFSEEFVKAIPALAPETLLLFDNIKAVQPEGSVLVLPQIKFKLRQ